MALKVVTGKLTNAANVPIGYATVSATLSAQAVITGTQEIASTVPILGQTGPDGTWSLSLESNLDLTPNTTYYTIAAGSWSATVVVQSGAGPFKVEDIMATPPVVSPPGALDSQVVHLANPETITGVKSGTFLDGGGAEINALHAKYGIKGDGQYLTDGAITTGTAILTSPGNKLAGAVAGQLISVIGAGSGVGIAAVPLVTTILSVQSAGQVTLNANASRTVSGATAFFASDDTAGFVSWLADLVSVKAPGFLPAKFYGLNGTLTMASQLKIAAAGVREIFTSVSVNSNIWIPTVAPYLTGAVLWQFAAADAVQVTAIGQGVDLADFGVMFANLYNGAGHGFNCAPSPLNAGKFDSGIVGSSFDRLKVYGHDGNHYGFIFNNPEYCQGYGLRSYGGGGFKIRGESAAAVAYGNSTFVHPVAICFTGGSADATNITADAFQHLDLLAFMRLQSCVISMSPALQGNVAPTGAQRMFFSDANVPYINSIGDDFETNVGSAVTRSNATGLTSVGGFGPVPWVNFVIPIPNQTGMQIFSAAGQTADMLILYLQQAYLWGISATGHFRNAIPTKPASSALGANITSVTSAGTDVMGTLTVVVAAGGLAANTKIATLTFAATYGGTAPSILLTNQTSGAGLAVVNPYVLATSTGVSFDLACNQALVAGTYVFGYFVIGTN